MSEWGAAARDAAVIECLPLVKRMATGIHRQLPAHVDLDDLVHDGVLGLLDAADRYDPARETHASFQTFAKYRIRGAIIDGLRQLDWATREMRRERRRIATAESDLAAELNRTPTEEEMARKLGIDLDRWHALAGKFLIARPGRIRYRLHGQDDEDLLIEPGSADQPENRPDAIYEREQLRARVWSAIGTLPRRHSEVMKRYYVDELTMKQIAQELGVHVSRVSQLHISALQKIRLVWKRHPLSLVIGGESAHSPAKATSPSRAIHPM